MYARYDYAASATLANVVSDIGNILIGETDKANLSAGCVQATTEIISDVASGWTLHDFQPGAWKATAYRAPLADDAATFKYLVLDFNTSNFVMIKAYETWDEISHVGTNLCYNSDSTTYGQRIDLTSGGTMYIFASARFCMFVSQTATYSSSFGPSGIFERTRDLPFDTVAAGYPPWVWHSLGYANQGASYAMAYAPRLLDRFASEITGSSAACDWGTVGYADFWHGGISGMGVALF